MPNQPASDDDELANSVGELSRVHFKLLVSLGKDLATKFRYEGDEIEACRRYLCDRYGWSPTVSKSLGYEDLLFLLRELTDPSLMASLPAPQFGTGVVEKIVPKPKKPRKPRLNSDQIREVRDSRRT